MNEAEREKEAARVLSCIQQMDGYDAKYLNCPLCPIGLPFDVLTLEAHVANMHLHCGSFKCTCKQVLFTFPHMQEHIKQHRAKGEEHACKLRHNNKEAFVRNSEIPKIISIAFQNYLKSQAPQQPEVRTVSVQHFPRVANKTTQINGSRPKPKKDMSQQTELTLKIPRKKVTCSVMCQTPPQQCAPEKTKVSSTSVETQRRKRKQKTVETQTKPKRQRVAETQTKVKKHRSVMISPIKQKYTIPKKDPEVPKKELFWSGGQQPGFVAERIPTPLSPASLGSVRSSGSNENFEPTSPFPCIPVASHSTQSVRIEEPPLKMKPTPPVKPVKELKPLFLREKPVTPSNISTNRTDRPSLFQKPPPPPAEVRPEPAPAAENETGTERVYLFEKFMNIKREPMEEMPPPASPEPSCHDAPRMEEMPSSSTTSNVFDSAMDTLPSETPASEEPEEDAPKQRLTEEDLFGAVVLPSRFERTKTPNPSQDRALARLEALNPTTATYRRPPKRRRDLSPARRFRRTPSYSPPSRRSPSYSSSSSSSRSRSRSRSRSSSRSRSPTPVRRRRTPSPEIPATSNAVENQNVNAPDEEEKKRLAEEDERRVAEAKRIVKEAKWQIEAKRYIDSLEAKLECQGFVIPCEQTSLNFPHELNKNFFFPRHPPPAPHRPRPPAISKEAKKIWDRQFWIEYCRTNYPKEFEAYVNKSHNKYIPPQAFDPKELAKRCQMAQVDSEACLQQEEEQVTSSTMSPVDEIRKND